MPDYTHDIPAMPSGDSLPIRRTPSHGTLVAIVTTPDLIGCFTHYYHGRTQPCEGLDCKAHADGVPFRWHAYLGAAETKSGLHFIFEVTANGAEAFITYRQAHGQLRGCIFQARRWRERPNGRIMIQCKPADLNGILLPKPPDMIKCLATLWGLTTIDVEPTERNPDKRTDIYPLSSDKHKHNQNPPPARDSAAS